MMLIHRSIIIGLLTLLVYSPFRGTGQTVVQNQDSIDILLNSAQKNTYKKPGIAEQEARKAHALALEQEAPVKQGEALRVMGGSYFVRGDYDLALDNFLAAKQLFDNQKDTAKLCRIMSNIGLVYKSLGNYQTSLSYYGEALQLSPKDDSLARSKIYNNIGVVYKHLKQYDTAYAYFNRSLTLKRALGNTKGMANTLTNLGNIAGLQNNNRKAIELFRQSLDLEKSLDHQEGIAKNVNNMARAYYRMANYDSAIHFAQIGLEIGQQLGTKIQISEAAETLAKCFDKKNKHRLAYTYFTLHAQMKDSLKNEDLSRRIGQLESKLEIEQKNKEIQTLTFEKQLGDVQLSEARLQILILVLSIIFILTLATIFFVFYLKKQKADKLAQQLQYDALQKRYIDLIEGPSTFDLTLQLDELNKRLVNPLTEREYEVLQLSLSGMSNKQIADKIFVSVSTIKFHLGNVYNKFGVSNKNEALEYVVKTS